MTEPQLPLWFNAQILADLNIFSESILLEFEFKPESASAWMHLHLHSPIILTGEDRGIDHLWLEFENAVQLSEAIHLNGPLSILAVEASNELTLCVRLYSSDCSRTFSIAVRSDVIYPRKSKYAENMNIILAKSEDYSVKRQCEEAQLIFNFQERRSICVGDHYGDVQCASISPNQRWCVTCGAGIIIYHLIEPFQSYEYDQQTTQWYEYGRDPNETDYIERILSINDEEVAVVNFDGETEVFCFSETDHLNGSNSNDC